MTKAKAEPAYPHGVTVVQVVDAPFSTLFRVSFKDFPLRTYLLRTDGEVADLVDKWLNGGIE